jgi:hypothetical protein
MKFLQRERLAQGQRRTEILCTKLQEFFVLCNVLSRKCRLIRDHRINRGDTTTRAVHFYNETKNIVYSVIYREWEEKYESLAYTYKHKMKEHTIRLTMRNNRQLTAWTTFFKDIADRIEVDYLSLTKIYYVADYVIKVKIEIG